MVSDLVAIFPPRPKALLTGLQVHDLLKKLGHHFLVLLDYPKYNVRLPDW
jgi:hypothetical protein